MIATSTKQPHKLCLKCTKTTTETSKKLMLTLKKKQLYLFISVCKCDLYPYRIKKVNYFTFHRIKIMFLFFGMFCPILFLDPTSRFCKGYTPWISMKAIFANIQNNLIFRIFAAFKSGFLHRITITCL